MRRCRLRRNGFLYVEIQENKDWNNKSHKSSQNGEIRWNPRKQGLKYDFANSNLLLAPRWNPRKQGLKFVCNQAVHPYTLSWNPRKQGLKFLNISAPLPRFFLLKSKKTRIEIPSAFTYASEHPARWNPRKQGLKFYSHADLFPSACPRWNPRKQGLKSALALFSVSFFSLVEIQENKDWNAHV